MSSQEDESDSDSNYVRRKLTISDKLKAIRAVQRGEDIQDVAEELKITTKTIRNWLKSEEDFKRVVEYENDMENKTKTEKISKKIAPVLLAKNGEPTETGSGEIKKNKVRIKRTYDLQTKFEALSRIKNGESIKDVARSLNVKAYTIRMWRRSDSLKNLHKNHIRSIRKKIQRETKAKQQLELVEEKATDKDDNNESIRLDVSKKRQALDLLRNGSNPVEVARELNLPLYSVVAWQKNQTIGKKAFYPLETKLRAIQLDKQGRSVTEISRILQAPKKSVSYWLKRTEALKKLASTSPSLPTELKRSIVESGRKFSDTCIRSRYSIEFKRAALSLMRVWGKSLKEVASFMQVPWSTLDGWARDKTLKNDQACHEDPTPEKSKPAPELPVVAQSVKIDSIRLIRRGVSQTKIAKDLGVTTSTVASWLTDDVLLKKADESSKKVKNRILVKNPLSVKMFQPEFPNDVLVAVLQDFDFEETEILTWMERRKKEETAHNNRIMLEKGKRTVDPFSDDDCAVEIGEIFSNKCNSDSSNSDNVEVQENGNISDNDYSYVTYEEAMKMCKTDV